MFYCFLEIQMANLNHGVTLERDIELFQHPVIYPHVIMVSYDLFWVPDIMNFQINASYIARNQNSI